MATRRDWIAGARPRTLSSAIAPVAVGTASAGAVGRANLGLALLALLVALALQVGVNYANDYSDGVRGTDANRVGPARLTATGKAAPSIVKRAAFIAFGFAAISGAALAMLSGLWWLMVVGVVCVGAAWLYTGSSRPYGYEGWGEVSVFTFFGLVATLGTMVAQAHTVTWWAVLAAAGVGAYSVALLLVNNIRDREHDAVAGKRTLAVRLGDAWARRFFQACVTLPLALAVAIAFARPWALIVAPLLIVPALATAFLIRPRISGRALRPAFAASSLLGLAYGLLLALGIAI